MVDLISTGESTSRSNSSFRLMRRGKWSSGYGLNMRCSSIITVHIFTVPILPQVICVLPAHSSVFHRSVNLHLASWIGQTIGKALGVGFFF